MSVHKERREKLAQALRELPLENWCYDEWESECGTRHCAAGLCPSLFPNEWKWGRKDAGARGGRYLKYKEKKKFDTVIDSLSEFFCLSYKNAAEVFLRAGGNETPFPSDIVDLLLSAPYEIDNPNT